MPPQDSRPQSPASNSSDSSESTVMAVANVANFSYPMRLLRSPSSASFEAEILESTPYKRNKKDEEGEEGEEEEYDLLDFLRVPSPSPSPPASSFITNEYQHQHQPVRHLSPQPSYTTSTVSRESLATDYGLHRALNSVVVPNSDNPIATIKDRKNAGYLEKLEETHARIKAKLDKAVEEYTRVTALRDTNDDPKLEFLLNRQYLEASNALGHSSREYNAYIDSLNELRTLPKVTRQEFQLRYTDVRANVETHFEDGTSSSVQHQLRKTRGKIHNLEKERQDLIEKIDPIGTMAEHVAGVENRNVALAEHVAYIEHLNTELKRDVKKWTVACNALQNRVVQLERANMLSEKAKWQLEKTLSKLEKANRTLTEDVDAHRGNAAHIKAQLKDAREECKKVHSQLGFAAAVAEQHKDEAQKCRERTDQLDDDMVTQSEELEWLTHQNEVLREDNERLQGHLFVTRQAHDCLKGGFGELVLRMSTARRERKRANSV